MLWFGHEMQKSPLKGVLESKFLLTKRVFQLGGQKKLLYMVIVGASL
jgi:hypothetical protein